MVEQWQLYDEQGNALDGQGAGKAEVFEKGLLHAASHVWIWRVNHGQCELLVQKRGKDKKSWPNLYDISAAGHVDLNETPLQAALRETFEEIGIHVKDEDLKLFTVHRAHLTSPDGIKENEFQWLYSYKLQSLTDFKLDGTEVSDIKWKSLKEFESETMNQKELYVSHSNIYFETVIDAIMREYRAN